VTNKKGLYRILQGPVSYNFLRS